MATCPAARHARSSSQIWRRAARARGRWPAAGQRATRALTLPSGAGHRGGAAVRDVFSLEEVPPSLISPLVTGTEPVDPSTYVTFFRPWTQALECTRRGHGRPCWIPRTVGVFLLIEGSQPPSWTVGSPPHLLSDSGERASWLLGAGPSGRVGSIISGACFGTHTNGLRGRTRGVRP